jgi:hypothetical protein
MTPCELRLKAAEVIDQRGLNKGKLINNDGCVCLLGALIVALEANPLDEPQYIPKLFMRFPLIQQACRAMGFETMNLFGHIPHPHDWNDMPERTKEDVIARLRDGCTEAREASAS